MALNRMSSFKELAIFSASTGLLYLYFLPFFFSSRFLEYLTPLVALYVARVLMKGYRYVSSLGSRKGIGVNLLGALFIALIALAMVTYLPMNYAAFLEYLSGSDFKRNGYLSVVSFEDLKALKYLEGISNVLVITDYSTGNLFRYLSGDKIAYRANAQLFYSYTTLRNLAGERNVVIVINSRTFKWLSGSSDKPFIGFRRILSANRTLERLVLGRNYYLFKLRRGVKPVVAEGPKLPVLTDKGLIDVPTRIEYYEPFDARCYLTLNGSSTYRILRYPGNWVFMEVKVGRRKLPLPRDRDEFIALSGFRPKDKVTLVWRVNLLYNQTGYKESDFKDWVSFGSPTWSQIENLNLNVDLERYPVMILGVEGSRNATFEGYLFLSDGRVVNVFSGRIKAPTSLAEIAVDFSPAPKGVKVSGIMFKSYSLDGKPHEFRIGYVIFAKR